MSEALKVWGAGREATVVIAGLERWVAVRQESGMGRKEHRLVRDPLGTTGGHG